GHRLPDHALSLPARQRRRRDHAHLAAAAAPERDELPGPVRTAPGAAVGTGQGRRLRPDPAARRPQLTGGARTSWRRSGFASWVRAAGAPPWRPWPAPGPTP